MNFFCEYISEKNPYYLNFFIIFKIMLKVKRRVKATRRLNGNYTTNLLNYMMSFLKNKNLSILNVDKNNEKDLKCECH